MANECISLCSNHLHKKFKELKFDTQSLLPPVSAKDQTCEASAYHRSLHLKQDSELLYELYPCRYREKGIPVNGRTEDLGI